jgi:replicative DNA helicase
MRNRRDPVKLRTPPIIRGRVPPHELDAEAAVLSALLLSGEALDQVAEFLKPEHFYSDANGRIYEAAQTLALAGSPIDVVSVASWLRDRERLAQVGGPSYLGQLADATPAVAHVAAHAQTVVAKWRRRALVATCQRIAAEGYGDVGDEQAFIDAAEQAIYELAHTSQRRGMKTLKQALREHVTELMEANKRGDQLVGMSSGYHDLDELLAGLRPGQLVVVGARPGSGKTAFALNLTLNVARPRVARVPHGDGYVEVNAAGWGACVFSCEMPTDELAGRTVVSEGRIDGDRYRHRRLTNDDWRRLTGAVKDLVDLPVWIDETPAITLLEMRAKVRRVMAEYHRPATADRPERKVGLVVVDYLQLMQAPEGIELREQQIAALSRGLKAMAKELGVTVVALSQLNRAVETRTTKHKRPQLSDLRDSGQIEQDADAIIFLYRPELYFPGQPKWAGLAQWVVAKQRGGRPGRIWMRFASEHVRFDPLAPGDDRPDEDDLDG